MFGAHNRSSMCLRRRYGHESTPRSCRSQRELDEAQRRRIMLLGRRTMLLLKQCRFLLESNRRRGAIHMQATGPSKGPAYWLCGGLEYMWHCMHANTPSRACCRGSEFGNP